MTLSTMMREIATLSMLRIIVIYYYTHDNDPITVVQGYSDLLVLCWYVIMLRDNEHGNERMCCG